MNEAPVEPLQRAGCAALRSSSPFPRVARSHKHDEIGVCDVKEKSDVSVVYTGGIIDGP